MAKYRKKPIIIEAFQYDGDLMNKNGSYYVPDWAVKAFEKSILFYDSIDSTSPPCDLFVITLEGKMLIGVNDFVIQGIKGEIYPCKEDIFKMTYDEIIES